ncbi:hypothetical protein CspeluHIS016_0603880 [Cutaneotrichosporon spelunceum]|uniref:Uncharacterized protein n=1 Tax=Cutaneotrichosporon spelunceum TaxID=1672016 RepID=A0AAD3TXZ4_9TREE|nr:hypothetical protein CspeluHIS016_0603880 [Cutaneotrichosporon spelunceum]
MAPSKRPTPEPPKPARKSKTRGRITRGRIVPATRITDRTHVWNGLREHIAAAEAAMNRERASESESASASASTSASTTSETWESTEPTTPEDNLPYDMGIFLESSTDDIMPTEFRREFNTKFELKGTCTLHLGQELLKQSKKWTAADVGLKEGDTIDVQFWIR